ncbi:MAG: homocysteine S-methyltransferase family protein [Planctomycetota bacterium]
MKVDFATSLEKEKTILLDGAIGTELDKRGLMSRGATNLENPQAVLQIQQEYAQSGCHALTANTLTMNRIYIETHNVGVSVEDVNTAGVELARKAAGDSLYVLGNISSTGQLLEPYGDYSESQFCEAFAEQAEILARVGVDSFLIETVIDLREAICAVRACKEQSPLPVIASIAFATETKGARTVMGDSAEDCAVKLADAGADVVGANCGDLDPDQIAQVISLLSPATQLPILAQPNAGLPKLIDGKTVFDMTPPDFAEGIVKCVEAGARIVGGCCGTTPEHIRSVADAIGAQ